VAAGSLVLAALAFVAGAYQLLAIAACLRFRRSASAIDPAPGENAGGISILKPVHGLDPALRGAIESHLNLLPAAPGAELLCGVRSLDDPAVPLLRKYPGVRVIECSTQTANAKVGVLIDLAHAARGSILVVNDADIRVEAGYLERVTAPLGDPRVGLVTCLYRPEGTTFAARFEGLGVSTDFAPSAMVARLVGVDEFAMGSTLAFRRADLEKIGGFEAIADYLADDYQLGHRIHALGLKCELSGFVVSTHLGGGWRDVWTHQVRWARTIRVSKFSGYAGLPATFATLWALLAAGAGAWRIAVALIAVRMLMATVSGWFTLRSRDVLVLWLLIPARDLFGAAVWLAGLFGKSVTWRGRQLKLDREGRIST
jgi:ceramide glucosyltransferase